MIMISKTMVAAMILVMAKKSDSDDDERPIIKVEWDNGHEMKGDSEQQVNRQLLISGQVFGGFSEGYCDLDSLFSISKRQPYTDSIFNVWKRNGLSEFYCPCSRLHFLRGVRKLLIASASFDKMQKLESQPHQDTSSVIGNPNAHS